MIVYNICPMSDNQYVKYYIYLMVFINYIFVCTCNRNDFVSPCMLCFTYSFIMKYWYDMFILLFTLLTLFYLVVVVIPTTYNIYKSSTVLWTPGVSCISIILRNMSSFELKTVILQFQMLRKDLWMKLNSPQSLLKLLKQRIPKWPVVTYSCLITTTLQYMNINI